MSFVSKKNHKNTELTDNAAKKKSALPPRPLSDIAALSGQDLGIMVVNEAVDILDEVAALLRRRGLVVHVSASAHAARTTMVQHPEIAVLVADISLLEGEGLELAAQVLGGKTPSPAVELVLITGYGGRFGEQDTQLGSRIGLLQEPLRLRDIAVSVGQALGRAAARRALPASQEFRTYDAD